MVRSLSFRSSLRRLAQTLPSPTGRMSGRSSYDPLNRRKVHSRGSKILGGVGIDGLIQLNLVVCVNSANSKIMAGVAAINAFNPGNHKISMLKCSDKTAYVQLSVSYSLIDKLSEFEEERSIHKKLSQSRLVNEPSLKLRKPPIIEMSHSKGNDVKERDLSNDSRLKFILEHRSGKETSRFIQKVEVDDQRVQNYKKVNDQLEREIDRSKEEILGLKRKDRERQTELKQIRDNLEKRKVKISDLQGKLSDLTKQLSEGEKQLKNSEVRYRQLVDKYQNLQIKYLTLQKKMQSKQVTFSEKEKKLFDKLSASDAALTNITRDYNLLLQSLQEKQKVNQTNIKNKQKINLEEKTKLRQAISRLQNQLMQIREERDDLSIKVGGATSGQKSSYLKISELQTKLNIANSNLQNQRLSIQKYELSQRQLEHQLNDLRTSESEKSGFKRKYYEMNQESIKLKEKLDRLSGDYDNLKEKDKKLQESLQQIKKEKKILLNKISDLQKNYAALEKQFTRLQFQNNNLSSKNVYLTERINDLKTKFDQQKRESLELQNNLQTIINNLNQGKEYLQGDIQDLKWSLDRERETVSATQEKLKQKGDQIIRLQTQLYKKTKQIQDLSFEISQNKLSLLNQKGQFEGLSRREKELGDVLKQKQFSIHQLNKRIYQLDQEIFLSRSKLEKTIEEDKQRISSNQELIEQLRAKMGELGDKVTELVLEIQGSKEKVEFLENELRLNKLGLEYNQTALSEEKEKFYRLQKQYSQVFASLKQLQSRLSLSQQEADSLTRQLGKQLEDKGKQNKSLNLQIDGFKKSLEHLLLMISTPQEQNQSELVLIPDERLSKIHMDAVVNRNKILSNYRIRIADLQAQVQFLVKQFEIKEAAFKKRIEDIQKTEANKWQENEDWLRKKQEEKRQLESDKILLNEEIQRLKNQKEKLNYRIKSLQEIEQDNLLKIKSYESHTKELREQNKHLQENILKLKTNHLDNKALDEITLNQVKQDYENEIERYKLKNSELLKNLDDLEKEKVEKQKSIEVFLVKTESLQEQIRRNLKQNQKLIQKIGKLTESKSEGQAKILDLNRQLGEVKYQLSKVETQLKSELGAKNQLANKLQDYYTQISDLTIQKQALQSQYETLRNASKFTQGDLSDKIVQLGESLQKEIIKNKQLNQSITVARSEIQLKQFVAHQFEDKLEQLGRNQKELRKQNEEKKSVIIKLSERIQQLKNQLVQSGKSTEDVQKQKEQLLRDLHSKKEKIEELQSQVDILKVRLQDLTTQVQNYRKKLGQLNEQNINLQTGLMQMKDNLIQNKKEAIKVISRQLDLKAKVKQLQESLRQQDQSYNQFKNKNLQSKDRQIIALQNKCRQQQKKSQELQKAFQQEVADLKQHIQLLKKDQEEFQDLLERKEEIIEQQQRDIQDAEERISSLSGQLRACLQAWENEKTASLPSRKQIGKIEEQMTRFQVYSTDLDRRSRQIISSSLQQMRNELFVSTAATAASVQEWIGKVKNRLHADGGRDWGQLLRELGELETHVSVLAGV